MHTFLRKQLYRLKENNQKAFAVLVDPDKIAPENVPDFILQLEQCKVDILLVGGSLIQDNHITELVPQIKSRTDIPVVLFPGSAQQIVPTADAILFLSLISGRNPDFLIGQQVLAAPMIRQANLEVLATGYMLIDAGNITTANYMSHTLPIPHDKPNIAVCTAMAGEMLGHHLIYMDGGSGAQRSISSVMISSVRKHLEIPLIVGGGIRSKEEALRIWESGADMIVIGNAIEADGGFNLMEEVASVKSHLNSSVAAGKKR